MNKSAVKENNHHHQNFIVEEEQEQELSLKEVQQKLLVLAEKGLITKTPINICKMSEQVARNELRKYEIKQTKETAERIKNIILKGMTKTFTYF